MKEQKIDIGEMNVPEDLNSVNYDGKQVAGKYLARWCGRRDDNHTVLEIRRPGLAPWFLEMITLGHFVKRVSMAPREMKRISIEKRGLIPE